MTPNEADISFPDVGTEAKAAWAVTVRGIVQGVGFRPFIYQSAVRRGLAGTVSNTPTGVQIHVEGDPEAIRSFMADVRANAPPLSHITEMDAVPAAFKYFDHFSITASRSGNQRATLISPDVSICEDCLSELFDPQDRRYRYPFINCTNCGPRYTIVDDIPYDRANTSMKHFPMCTTCKAEYEDPQNRRFHAQPNACPDCGPHVSILDANGGHIACKDPIARAAGVLEQGGITAVKGLGGFHLAADATNEKAVNRLRAAKHRAAKPFALMTADMEAIEAFACMTAEEKALLLLPWRPIVLLKKRFPNTIASSVSPENQYFGVMLPYTPLHYLLFSHGFSALVMTSGNLSEEPIAIDNLESVNRLAGIADVFLVHNRDIYMRSDDSIVQHVAGAPRLLRRARGYVPAPVFLDQSVPAILACGAELKNTFCLTKNSHAFLSQHIGDLENLRALDFFRHTVESMKRLLDIEPGCVACDMHPDYFSTRYARQQKRLPCIEVQHHHAHIVSCMAENHVQDPVIGLAFDGTGYGTDGAVWGGEVLIADRLAFRRAAHLSYAAMPGGAAAVKEPWRMGLSCLLGAYDNSLEHLELPFLDTLDPGSVRIIKEMIQKRVNAPLTSSMGRLFDAVAAICGLRSKVDFEAQAAMELEALAAEHMFPMDPALCYDYEIPESREEALEIPVSGIIRAVVRDLQDGVDPAHISTRFHTTLVILFADVCCRFRQTTGLERVALSGGVFQNVLLLEGLCETLSARGFSVIIHRHVPANDGGICLGQAMVAAARFKDQGW